jgi:hypothetical protein
MAQATHNPAVTRTEVVEITPGTVTLTLSMEEAVTLATLLASVAGCSRKSLRKRTDEIGHALGKAGVRWSPVEYDTMVKTPYFKECSL